MRREHALLSSAIVAATACAAASAPSSLPPDARAGSHSAAAGWKELRERTTCEAMRSEFCVGYYGFSVSRTGGYTVGPARDGTTHTGAVTPEELDRLAALVNAVVAAMDPRARPTCLTEGLVPGASDRISIVLDDDSSVDVFQASGVPRQTCFQGGEANARALHDAIRALLLKYYPRPFP